MNQYKGYASSVKKYRRMRIKWLLLVGMAAGFILWFGIKSKNMNPRQDKEKTSQEVLIPETPEDDYQYLEESPDIRVILQAGNYQSIYHAKVDVQFPKGGYVLVSQDNHWEKISVEAGRNFSVGIGDEFDVNIKQDMLVAFLPASEDSSFIVNNIDRGRETCSYYGRLEVTLEEGGLLAVNVLPLETYLCGVVPSEMPASYDLEALRAQAILARTYAYKYLIHPAYSQYGANVDDSISFQVYGNIEQSAAATRAVRDTTGVLLFSGKSLAEVYYYSTSCGFGTDGTVWGGAGQEYLRGIRIGAGTLQNEDGSLRGAEAERLYVEGLKKEQVFRNMITKPFVDGYESEEAWYRWNACSVEVDADVILERLKERYHAKPEAVLTQNKQGDFESKAVKSLGEIRDIYVEERGEGGVCKSLIIQGTKNTYKVLLEYNIRYVLNGSGVTVTRSDGSTSYCKTLLPSGFFYLDTVHFGQNVISYNIYGGGYGHGVGMSQNGANQMAKAGLSCQDILEQFFPGTVLVSYDKNS